jgi:hypothetical protein
MAHGRPDASADTNGIRCEDDVNRIWDVGVPGGKWKERGSEGRGKAWPPDGTP